ncbi:MAG: hypothetical protein UR66_C0013G0008 [Candidatus Moranbacteria bacterium GW2011_GWE1_35_17]|nr:MAG: hypothetical protein UR66_C0013G0008 [Candidatus Moranbacteria bacterium GW2011_GWE1_35_17]KKP68730.1 MAG: hypothetical protein UR65_C0056G0002 [Candidatus Moranbacteria bacterium GW2011_GWE2_35_164]KKP84426.1 MAG: hypothetical protein UR83_C0021G0003 [Candidatus Moranbacteria bacterium GW2011_GWF2_35_54]
MNKNKQRILPSTIIFIVLGVAGILLAVLIAGGDRFTRNGLSQNKKNINKNQSINGDIWFSCAKEKIKSGEDFDIDVYINTKGNNLGVFALNFNFDKKDLTVDIESGEDGISKGIDSENFIIMSNPNDITSEHFRFSGICAQNCANGNQKNIAVIHAKAKADFNFSDIVSQLEVKELANELGKAIAFKKNNGVITIK